MSAPGEFEDDSDRLRPCPFCGGEAEIGDAVEAGPSAYVVSCLQCQASSAVVFACGDDPLPVLMSYWNRRAPEDADTDLYFEDVPPEEVKALLLKLVETEKLLKEMCGHFKRRDAKATALETRLGAALEIVRRFDASQIDDVDALTAICDVLQGRVVESQCPHKRLAKREVGEGVYCFDCGQAVASERREPK